MALAERGRGILVDARIHGLAATFGAPLIGAAITLWLVIPTLMPGVGTWDTAEFQAVGPVLGTGHPTGYPAYVVLGWIGSHLLPFGEPAYRMNLLQAILAAVAVAAVIAIVAILTRRRLIALAAGLLLCWQKEFWSLATHADYHMFHVALVGLIFVALLLWERRRVTDGATDGATEGGSGGPKGEEVSLEGRWLLAATALYGVVIAWAGLRLAIPIAWLIEAWIAVLVLVLAGEAFMRERRARATRADAAPPTASDSTASPASTRRWRRFSIAGDGWLAIAALIYGVAVANHGLAWLLPPAIGLFVLAVDPLVLLRWRTVIVALAVLAATIVLLYAEMPIRAAMNAPLVYDHPNTVSGFKYVVFAEQFGFSNPWNDLAHKSAATVDLLAGWLGPLGLMAAGGLITSLIRRPRFVVLSGGAAVVTAFFAQSYVNADLNRYYLVPLFVAICWVGLFAADMVSAAAWLSDQVARVKVQDIWSRRTVLGLEAIAALVLVFTTAGVVPERQQQQSAAHPGGVSESKDTGYDTWMRRVLAPPDRGGLPENAVLESWWSASTTLWYGQKALGLRPDVLIIDDSTRKNDHIGAHGEVWDVFDTYLGKRPVFADRFDGGCDGLRALSTIYDIQPTDLPGIHQIASRTSQDQLPPCDPVR